ncbi:MAG: hypothetical protein A2W52_03530 [Candidatus Taylorbacteria bacterium RIFCSPHIGHO2_02_49_25]|uniref:Uncharacterized protein n=1 Tax=Candidatus Taylorbacteria bacterium RIFCSPHIGHO2_02_49_25 TaxID=1802305 RepID=A0A1G2MD83_9BACT|nr:MAG: hypothetical protein A2759_03035 [Candidatus Taylorbacteria bacterium RIFCSPHIGHO2_01_FULL_49_60]OHA21876.1 MAG: hypothetical protein A2W52_03530 [Candidatus Taylorbacteria bacterium RIFCSPHIGHO2_02_49_25]OHA47923.1 MAG: hypothetical protein A3G61_02080 [Candidatus Taylorbacteria bacterium RIFCSPLOWO2_12_FULL_49_67]HCB35281.1 hypothetical protein [Candidatus Taylorbacteria bacterium]
MRAAVERPAEEQSSVKDLKSKPRRKQNASSAPPSQTNKNWMAKWEREQEERQDRRRRNIDV